MAALLPPAAGSDAPLPAPAAAAWASGFAGTDGWPMNGRSACAPASCVPTREGLALGASAGSLPSARLNTPPSARPITPAPAATVALLTTPQERRSQRVTDLQEVLRARVLHYGFTHYGRAMRCACRRGCGLCVVRAKLSSCIFLKYKGNALSRSIQEGLIMVCLSPVLLDKVPHRSGIRLPARPRAPTRACLRQLRQL